MSNIRLSYSSLKTLQSCQSKYWHYKVAKTPHDSDYEESASLGLGKAFHQVLEKTFHRSYDEMLIMEAMSDHNVEKDEKLLLEIMLKKYVEYHKLSGLDVVKCELEISDKDYIGFVDAIAVEKGRGFWIIDLKTAARHDEKLLPRLSRDLQMALYSRYADRMYIAVPEIKDMPFLGCRYRQAIKSKAGTLSGLEKGVKIYDIEIPAEVLNPKEAQSIFQENYEIAMKLHEGESPKKNYNACMEYFSPCQYFSQCHGKEFSVASSRVKVHTLESIKDGELL